MTKYYSVNTTPATGPAAIVSLAGVLTSSGWTIISSSNGTNFTLGNTYVNDTDMANNYSWFTIQEPIGPGGREWCFQRMTLNTTWRVKVSPYAGFTGSATATQVPTATDEGLIYGYGTDASPTGIVLFPTDNTYTFHTIAESTPVGPVGNQVYGWWAFANLTGDTSSTTGRTFICQEPLASGSYEPLVGTRNSTTSGDADPCVYGCLNGSGGTIFWSQYYLSGDTVGGTSQDVWYNMFKHFYDYKSASGSITTTFEVLQGYPGGNNGNIRAGLSTLPDGEDILLPYIAGRQGYGNGVPRYQNIGYKGVLNFLRLRGTNRNPGDTINLASTDAYVYVYDLLIPWPQSVTPVF
jgi:hypothetical protein